MKLNVTERLGVLELLPKEGGYAALKTLRRAREVVALTPEEIKAFNYKETPAPVGNSVAITWDIQSEKVKDIPLDEYVMNTMRDILVKMEKEKKLSEQTFSLYEKFVINYNTVEMSIKQ